MPAIQLTRLRTQTAQLAEAFMQPALFRRRLHDILDFYADRTFRPGQSEKHRTLLFHYRVSPPVMRQIELDLGPLCILQPAAALDLADLIWDDGYLETRLLAIFILAQVPLTPPEPVIDRVRKWAKPGEDSQVLSELLSSGESRLQRERPDLWQVLIKEWLDSPDYAVEGIGLRALLSVVTSAGFQNLPVIFRMMTPAMQTVHSNLSADYLNLIEAMARLSPAETAFFLRQSVNASSDPATSRLVRKCLPFFDPGTQAALRATLVNRARSDI